MRLTTLLLNSIVAIFFSCFLGYTFVARQHLDSLARGFVTERTIEYSVPVVELADEALDSPLTTKLLSNDQTEAIRREIADYRSGPTAYISGLTQQPVLERSKADENPAIEKVASFKNRIRLFYDNALNALVADLQIFSISNLIAGLIAFGLAYRSSSTVHKPLAIFSFLIFFTVLYCSYIYIDALTFFSILFRMHMGWRYAGLLCVMTIAEKIVG